MDSLVHVRVDLQRSEVDALRSVLGSACDRMCLVDPNKRPSLREVITMLSRVPEALEPPGGLP